MNTTLKQKEVRTSKNSLSKLDGFKIFLTAAVLSAVVTPSAMANSFATTKPGPVEVDETSVKVADTSNVTSKTAEINTVHTDAEKSSSRITAQIAAQSILRVIFDLPSDGKSIRSIKVPTQNYIAILQELQNRNARFLAPGASAPAEAKAVLKLQAEDPGLFQIVYFM